MTKRLFVGIRVPDHLHGALATLQSGLREARWTAPENFHITLQFIGDVDGPEVTDISLVLSRVTLSSFEVSLRGLDVFGRKRPHALITQVASNSNLERLAEKVRNAVAPFCENKERRKFTPHVTLAYLKGTSETDVLEYLSRNALFAAQSFEVTEFELIESHLRSDGPLYQTLGTYALVA